MRIIAGSLLLLAALAAPVDGGQRPDDFARGLRLEPDGLAAIVELPMPEAVYRTVTRPDLGDLRVFDAEGGVVPHAVRRPRARDTQAPSAQRVPFFLVRGSGEADAARRLRVVTDDRGAIVDATFERAGGGTRVVALLVDLSGLSEPPSRIEFEWESADPEGFAATVRVEMSDDLSTWRLANRAAALAELRSGEQRLVRRSLELPSTDAQYLRVEWPDALAGVRPTAAWAAFPSGTEALARESVRVTANVVDAEPHAIEFDSGGVRPVDRVRVVFEARNQVADVQLLSRPSADAPWRGRFSGTVYHLQRGTTSVEREAIVLAPTTDRYWRIELDEERTWVGPPPALQLEWAPDVLTVVAQGTPPYTVAFGSVAVEGARAQVQGVLGDLDEDDRAGILGTARVSDAFELGGDARLVPPLPWRTWALWATLLCGVGVLGWMVRRLVV